MKLLLLIPAILLSLTVNARKEVLVNSGTTRTAPGIGGHAEIGYAFAKGDRITITATAEKMLDRMLIILYPDRELESVQHTTTPSHTFTMPASGIVVFRFISDRSGTNDIRYTVRRLPASSAVQRYNTRVIWQKPPHGRPGPQIPVRARH